jgi:DNA polymerase-3 subunit epsilon
MIDFIAVDVETANSDMASICQIGVVTFKNGSVVHKWQSLVNPESGFSEANISVHGITSKTVLEAPTFPIVYEELKTMLMGQLIASHMPFDRLAVNRAIQKYGLPNLSCNWIDTAQVARSVWEEFSRRGYGLENLANHFGIEFDHHSALEDARVAGEILVLAMKQKDFFLEYFAQENTNQDDTNVAVGRSNNIKKYSPKISLTGNPKGPFCGEKIVFTGELSVSREEAANLAAQAGCNVDPNVTSRTSILVVGTQDIQKLGGNQKSSKHRKAEELIRKGQSIRIISEEDFWRLIEEDTEGELREILDEE